MISIKRSEVPSYLQRGSFYESLPECDDEIFSIPSQYFKQTSSVNCKEDMIHLLSTLRYWCVTECPISLIKYCVQATPTICMDDLQDFVKDLKYLEILISLRTASTNARPRIAIMSGDINIVTYFIQSERYIIPSNACVFAAETGHTVILSLLIEGGWEEYEAAAMAAASKGQLECLQIILSSGGRSKHICIAAVQNGYLECLMYAHQHGCVLSPEVLDVSILNGQLDCFVYAHNNGCMMRPIHLKMCVRYNQLDLLTYIHEHGGVWDSKVSALCAEYCRLDMLTYAFTHSCPWDAHTCASAVANGHIECLQYLHQHGCPWDEGTTYAACLYGHVECLRYAHQQGCILHPECSSIASEHQQVTCIQYLNAIRLAHNV